MSDFDRFKVMKAKKMVGIVFFFVYSNYNHMVDLKMHCEVFDQLCMQLQMSQVCLYPWRK